MNTAKKDLKTEIKTDHVTYDHVYGYKLACIAQFWEAIGKPVDSKQLAVYARQLGDIPLEILEQVVSNLLSTRIYHTIPTIGEVWTELRRWFCSEIGYLMGDKPISVPDIKTLKRHCRSWQPPVGNKDAEAEA